MGKFVRAQRVMLACVGLSLFGCAAQDELDTTSNDTSAELADETSQDSLGSQQQAAVVADGGVGTAAVAGTGKWVLGYYAAYQQSMLAPSEVDWSGLTHIVTTRIKTNGGGRLQLDFDIDNTNGPALARDLATRAHANGKKALLMLGGAGQGWAILDSASDANRATFVRNLLQTVKDLGYDGLDLDWEDNLDFNRFIALARDLRNSPNKPAGLILTVPGNAINGNYQTVDPKIIQLITYLDQYSIMSYYPVTAMVGYGWQSWHNSPLTGNKPNTPVTIEDSLRRYVAAGAPKAKLSMGMSFYAICYTGSVTGPNQSTEGGVSIRGGDNDFPLSKLFANGGAFNATYRKWDSAAQVPYLSLPSPESHGCRYVSFDDEQSIQAKGTFTKTNGYGGIIVWTINQGYLRNSSKAPNALTQALKRGFLD